MSEVKRCTIGMGTFIEFTFPDSNEHAYREAVALLRDLEAQLSFFNPQSDVSRWNAMKKGEIAVFGARFVYLLDLCAKLNSYSDGVFDPRPKNFRKTPFADSYRLEGLRIEKVHDMTLDLGGIAKGYIVDQLVECFSENGVDDGIINAGGDLRCWGKTKRPVHIRIGQKALSNDAIEVENSAVCGSGWEPFCTVQAESAVLADAFTKIYMNAPRELGTKVSKKLGARVELISWLGS